MLGITCLDDIDALLADVEFDESIVAFFERVDSVELIAMDAVDVADVAQPRVEESFVAR